MAERPTEGLKSLVDATRTEGPRTVSEGERVPPAEPDRDRFGRYEIVERIGSGGMAVVYRARDPELLRDVALKLVRPCGKKHSRRRASRLLREARALAELSHPNVVEVFDVGQQGSTVYMSMQLVPGPDVNRWLRDGDRSWQDILQRFIAAGRGLQAAHEQGLVHRDFKPANVLIDADGETKVVDFGLVAEELREEDGLEAESSEHSRSEDSLGVKMSLPEDRTLGAVGTPVYMAPEQHMGDVDPRGDQFAFCVSLYEALFGYRPFTGMSMDELRANKKEGLPRPRQPGDVPGWILPILRRGAAPEPQDRYHSMAELLRRLERGQTRRRRTIQYALVGAGALIVVGAVWAQPVREPCDVAKEASSVWTSERRQRTIRAFDVTEVFAVDARTRVIEGIDGWVESHRRAAQEVCAQRDARTASPQTLDLRFACLRLTRRRLEPTLDLIEEGDLVQRVRAVDAVASLLDPSGCVELQTGDARSSALAGIGPSAREQSLWADLERIDIGLQIGEMDRTAQRLRDLDAETAEQPRSAARAKWLLLDQQMARRAGHLPRAAESGREAHALATALGLDEIAAQAAIELVSSVDPLSQDVDRWNAAAQSAIGRLGGRDDLDAMRLMAVATVRGQARQSDEALELAERAWARGQEALADRPDRLLTLARKLVELRLLAGRPVEALTLARRTTAEATAHYGQRHPDVARHRSAGAQALAKTGQYELAEMEYREAITILEDSGTSPGQVAKLRLNRGHTLLRVGRYEDALAAYAEARPQFEREERIQDVVLIMLSQSYVHELLGQYDEAQRRVVAARVAAEQSMGADSPFVAVAIAQQANVLVQRGDVERARALLRRAEDIEGGQPLPPSMTVVLRSASGKALLASGRPLDAVEQFELASQLQSQIGAEAIDRAEVDFHLARARYENGQHEQAVMLAQRALERFIEIGPGARLFRGRVESWLAERKNPPTPSTGR